MGLECSFATTLISIFNVNSHKESSGMGRHSCGLQKPAIPTFSLALSADQTQCGWLLVRWRSFQSTPFAADWLHRLTLPDHNRKVRPLQKCLNWSQLSGDPFVFSFRYFIRHAINKNLMRNTTPSPVIFPLTAVHSKWNLKCVVWKKDATLCGSIFFLCGQTGWIQAGPHYNTIINICVDVSTPREQRGRKYKTCRSAGWCTTCRTWCLWPEMPLFLLKGLSFPVLFIVKARSPMAQRSPWGLRPSRLSDAAASQKRGKYFLHAALHGKWQRKKVAKLIRGQLSSSPPAASAQKVSVRVMEEVLVLPSCSLNEEGISARSTTGLSITELTRPRPLGEWNPSLPVWLCSAPAEKANKHAPEFVKAFARRGRRVPRNAESPYVENKMMHEFAIMPCWVHLCVHRGAFFFFFFWENSLYFSLNSAFLEDRAVAPSGSTVLEGEVPLPFCSTRGSSANSVSTQR